MSDPYDDADRKTMSELYDELDRLTAEVSRLEAMNDRQARIHKGAYETLECENDQLTAELGHAKAFGEATDASLQAERGRIAKLEAVLGAISNDMRAGRYSNAMAKDALHDAWIYEHHKEDKPDENV